MRSIAAGDEAVAGSNSFGHSLRTDVESAYRCSLDFDAPYHLDKRKLQSLSMFPESPLRGSHLPGEQGQSRVRGTIMDAPAGLPDLCQLSWKCSGPGKGEEMAKNGVVYCAGQSGRPAFPNLKSKVSAAHFTAHRLTCIMKAT